MGRQEISDLRDEHLQIARRIDFAGGLRRDAFDEDDKKRLPALYSVGFVFTYLGKIKLTDKGREMLNAIDDGTAKTVG